MGKGCLWSEALIKPHFNDWSDNSLIWIEQKKSISKGSCIRSAKKKVFNSLIEKWGQKWVKRKIVRIVRNCYDFEDNIIEDIDDNYCTKTYRHNSFDNKIDILADISGKEWSDESIENYFSIFLSIFQKKKNDKKFSIKSQKTNKK